MRGGPRPGRRCPIASARRADCSSRSCAALDAERPAESVHRCSSASLRVRGRSRSRVRLTAELDALLVDAVVLVADDAERLVGATDAIAVLESVLRARPGRLRLAARLGGRWGSPSPRRDPPRTWARSPRDDIAFSATVRAAPAPRATPRAVGFEDGRARCRRRSVGRWAWCSARGAADDPERAFSAFLDEEVLAPLDARTRARVLDSAAVEMLAPGVLSALGLGPDSPRASRRRALRSCPLPTARARSRYRRWCASCYASGGGASAQRRSAASSWVVSRARWRRQDGRGPGSKRGWMAGAGRGVAGDHRARRR